MRKILNRFRLFLFSKTVLKIIVVSLGGLFFYRKRDRVKKSLLHNSGFLITAIHGLLLSLIAIVYRLIVALNWLIQQSR